MASPARGEIWLADLNPVRGHEQGGARPCLVVSADSFNQSLLDLVVVLPLTSKKKGFASHVDVLPRETGLKMQSFIKCEDVRSISKDRLSRRVGKAPFAALQAVEDKLRIIFDL